MWAEQFAKRLSGTLSMRPSEYMNRNVRVTPFHFEPIDAFLERFPQVSSVYCYSTDYPHVEGGKFSKHRQEELLARLDADTRDKYFRDNGAWLLPA